MEIGHLHDAVAMYKEFARQDPAEVIPMTTPQPTTFQSNIDYVREVLVSQIMLTASEAEYVDVRKLPYYLNKVGLGRSENFWKILLSAEKALSIYTHPPTEDAVQVIR
jgi:hypothetical protein